MNFIFFGLHFVSSHFQTTHLCCFILVDAECEPVVSEHVLENSGSYAAAAFPSSTVDLQVTIIFFYELSLVRNTSIPLDVTRLLSVICTIITLEAYFQVFDFQNNFDAQLAQEALEDKKLRQIGLKIYWLIIL